MTRKNEPKIKNEAITMKKKEHHERSFANLAKDYDWELIEYDQKVKILNIWWEEKRNRNRNLSKRS